MKFSEKDTNIYRKVLKEEGYDTLDDFIEGIQNGYIDLNSFQDGKEKPLFKQGHQMKIRRKLNLQTLPPAPPPPILPSSPLVLETFSNQLHPNDILLENGMYFLDCSTETKIKNIVPLYTNNLQKQKFILKLYQERNTREKECEILQHLKKLFLWCCLNR